jgi:hypothetical protein
MERRFRLTIVGVFVFKNFIKMVKKTKIEGAEAPLWQSNIVR